MQQKIKLEKIVKTIDFSDKCSVCGKQIKNCYYTNAGVMGMDCFLEAIGLPRVRNNTVKSPILPAEQYESLAEGIIKKLESITDNEWLNYWTEWFQGDMTGLFKDGFYFDIDFNNHGYPTKKSLNILMMNSDKVAHLTGTPMDMMDKVMNNKFYNNYYFQTGRYSTLHGIKLL